MINWENRHTVRSHLHLESHCFISNTANTVGGGFWAEETPWNQPKSSLTLSFQSAVNPFTNDVVTLNNQDDKKYDEWWKIHRFKGIHSNKVSLSSTGPLLGQMDGWFYEQWPMLYATDINTDGNKVDSNRWRQADITTMGKRPPKMPASFVNIPLITITYTCIFDCDNNEQSEDCDYGIIYDRMALEYNGSHKA